jgi:hypothetical protein
MKTEALCVVTPYLNPKSRGRSVLRNVGNYRENDTTWCPIRLETVIVLNVCSHNSVLSWSAYSRTPLKRHRFIRHLVYVVSYSVVPVNFSLLTITLYSSVITISVYNDNKIFSFMTLQPSSNAFLFSCYVFECLKCVDCVHAA